jgi:hypothetical protein
VRVRWLLHPVTAAVALVVGSVAGQASGVALLLLLVAGAAAGFANSGST